MKPRPSQLRHFALSSVVTLSLLGSLAAQTLSYDPDPAPGIQSGNGIWSSSATNWTPDDGATNSGWIDGRDAIIGLGSKTITLDGANSVGDITRSGTGEAAVVGTVDHTLAINGVINVAAGSSLTLRGSDAAAFSGSFEKTGAGQLGMQNGTFNFSNITLTEGALTYFTAFPAATTTFSLNGGLISSTNNIGRTIAGATTIGGNIGIGNLPGATGLMTFSNTIDLTGGTRTLTIGGGGATFSGVVSNGGFIKEGTGNLLLSGAANTFTGNVTVNEGMIIMGKVGAFGAEDTAATKVTVASGAAVDLNGRGGPGTAYGYTISGTGNADTGALINNGGEISTSLRQVSNITLAADAAIGGTGNWAMLAPGFAANTIDLAGHTLTKVGSNTVTLVTTTTTTGAIRITEGGISFGATNATNGVTGAASSLVLDNTAGVSLTIAKNSSIGSLAGGGATGGGINLIDGNRTLTIGALNANTEYAGPISNTVGNLSITKVGTGTQTLSGINTYTGATNVSAGRLSLVQIASIPNVALVNVASGAGFGGIVGPSNLQDADIQNIVDNTAWASGSFLVIDTNGSDVTVAADITGDIGLIKKGGGVLTLTGNNTYTGATLIEGGSIAGTSNTITDVTIVKSGTNVTLTFNATGNVDVYRSNDLQTWGAPHATNVTSPYTDTAATESKFFYVLVPTGQPYP